MSKSGVKPIIDELDFVPQTLEEQRQLVQALVEAGTTKTQARMIAMVLSDLPPRYSRAFSVQMTGYRKHLARLGCPPWEGRRVDRRAVSSVRAMKRLRNHQPQGLRFPRRWARSAA